MKIDNISIGCIIENTDTNTRYRLIGLNDKDAVMCQMDITKLVFVVISAMQMLELIGNGVIKVQNDDDVIFNINKLSGKAREQFELKRNIMNEVNNLFGPYYTGLEKAIESLKKNFDYVILDTAPVGMVTDTLLIGRVADLSVYVCRADYTRKAEFTLINELAENNKLPNLCIAINGLDLQKKKYGYYYGYGKYGKYYGYGKRYGYGYGYGEHEGSEE